MRLSSRGFLYSTPPTADGRTGEREESSKSTTEAERETEVVDETPVGEFSNAGSESSRLSADD